MLLVSLALKASLNLLVSLTLVVSLILLVDVPLMVNLVVLLGSILLVDVTGGQLKGWQVDLFTGLMQEEGIKKPVHMVHHGKDVKTERTQVCACIWCEHSFAGRLGPDQNACLNQPNQVPSCPREPVHNQSATSLSR